MPNHFVVDSDDETVQPETVDVGDKLHQEGNETNLTQQQHIVPSTGRQNVGFTVRQRCVSRLMVAQDALAMLQKSHTDRVQDVLGHERPDSLPDAPEHHGTPVMKYFSRKAVLQPYRN